MTIKVGDRVKMFGDGKRWTISKNKERLGTVIRPYNGQYKNCYNVLWDGTKKPKIISGNYLEKISMPIFVGDIVYHQLSKLLFRCENKKHERWMNMNPFYQKTDLKTIDYEQWERTSK